MSNKILGVLGGMGPAATVDLFQNIINNTVVERDQDHLHMIIINDPHIPDRTNYILGEGESPLPRLESNLKKLEKAGATTVVLPCMTAHTFIKELQTSIEIPIINGVKLVQEYIEKNKNIKRIGLLATTGSVQSGIYQKYIKEDIVLPEAYYQNKIMNLIYGENGIKSGNVGREIVLELREIVADFQKKKVDAVIAGCTELGLVMNNENMHMSVIDPLNLLANHSIALMKETN